MELKVSINLGSMYCINLKFLEHFLLVYYYSDNILLIQIWNLRNKIIRSKLIKHTLFSTYQVLIYSILSILCKNK